VDGSKIYFPCGKLVTYGVDLRQILSIFINIKQWLKINYCLGKIKVNFVQMALWKTQVVFHNVIYCLAGDQKACFGGAS
jgi:hypothetical protein